MAFGSNIKVDILGDESSLRRAFANATRDAKRFNANVESGAIKAANSSASAFQTAFTKGGRQAFVSGFAGGATALFASDVAAQLGKAINAASDLNEQVTKSQQVFGDSADVVLKWSDTTSKALGVSKTAALEAAGTFGNLFSAVDIQGAKAADLSKSLVQLAADLASFNNADPSDVLLALRSGITGEVEPLRKFGILLSEARVQQEALQQTGKTSVKQLTNQEKVTARLAIIFRDTTKAQGDFARTSGGLANQQRILNAEVADLQANLGKLLLPAVTRITGELAKTTGAAVDLASALGKLGGVRIPPIKIPFTAEEVPGSDSTLGGLIGKVLSKTNVLAANPVVLNLKLAEAIKDQFDDAKPKVQVDVQRAIDNSPFTFRLPPIKLTPAVEFDKLPGVHFPGIADFGKNLQAAIQAAIDAADAAVEKGKKAIASDKSAKAAAAAAKARSDAFAKLIAALQLGVDRAELKRGLGDDLDALKDLKAGLQKQIKAGVDVASAQSQLVTVTGEIAAKQREIAQASKDAIQAAQFRALGLDATGNKPPPAIANLKKQLEQLSKRDDLTGADKGILARIRKVLVDPIHKATPETRAAIKGMFDAIRQEFDKGTKQATGPLTKTSAFNFNKVFGDLVLPRDLAKELRARVSGFNSAGLALAGKPIVRGQSFSGMATMPPINLTTTVVLDKQKVGQSNKRFNQSDVRRNPPQKRGPNGGI